MFLKPTAELILHSKREENDDVGWVSLGTVRRRLAGLTTGPTPSGWGPTEGLGLLPAVNTRALWISVSPF